MTPVKSLLADVLSVSKNIVLRIEAREQRLDWIENRLDRIKQRQGIENQQLNNIARTLDDINAHLDIMDRAVRSQNQKMAVIEASIKDLETHAAKTDQTLLQIMVYVKSIYAMEKRQETQEGDNQTKNR